MNAFISENFLLRNRFAEILYHEYAKALPIIDYHCHLSPKSIAENEQFATMTKIWLDGDHYKWRAMRTLGVAEQFITGNASDGDKFAKWAYAVPFTMRNPLYHWTHLELTRYFDINQLLNPGSADTIYSECNAKLNSSGYRTQDLLTRMNVETVCTTDDPIDSLEHHRAMQGKGETLILPTFRPDKSFAIENGSAYVTYLEKLSEVSGISITRFTDLMLALSVRIDYFDQHGCKLADHGLERLYYSQRSFNVDKILSAALHGNSISNEEMEFFKYRVLLELSKLYHAKSWTQQFHLGALRNTNRRMLQKLGPDTGFDSIGDFRQSDAMAKFLNELDSTDQLAKTILYNLNPADNEVLATMIGNFNDGSVKGKIQFGSGWWFLDQKDGMEKQMNTLSNLGLLSCFIGMLTDSRSFLSYPRHEYFRRILCNLIGTDVANGELPHDEKWLGKLIADICYYNAKEYFQFSPSFNQKFDHASPIR
jgi:glucuronate isomerase